MKHKCRKINSQIFQNAAISLCKSFLPNYPLTSRVVGKSKGGGCFSSSVHFAWLSAKFQNQFLRTAGECGLGEMDKTRNGRGPLFFICLGPTLLSSSTSRWRVRKRKRRDFKKEYLLIAFSMLGSVVNILYFLLFQW